MLSLTSFKGVFLHPDRVNSAPPLNPSATKGTKSLYRSPIPNMPKEGYGLNGFVRNGLITYNGDYRRFPFIKNDRKFTSAGI